MKIQEQLENEEQQHELFVLAKTYVDIAIAYVYGKDKKKAEFYCLNGVEIYTRFVDSGYSQFKVSLEHSLKVFKYIREN